MENWDRILRWLKEGLLRTVLELQNTAGQGNMPCLFYTATGFYCPGCGGTRAFRAFLEGHLVQSFLLHPLVLFMVVSMPYLVIQSIYCWKKKKTFSRKIWENVLLIGICLLVGNFLLKNALLLIFKIDLLAFLYRD
ncbi:MAG: DUF2752 domain-containing protein [Clostridium sp.]|jgi:hypothetical protein